LKNYVTW